MPALLRYIFCTSIFAVTVAGCSGAEPAGQQDGSSTAGGQSTTAGGSSTANGGSTASGGGLTAGTDGSNPDGVGGRPVSGGSVGVSGSPGTGGDLGAGGDSGPGGDTSSGGDAAMGGDTNSGGSGGSEPSEPAPGCGNAGAAKGAQNLTISVNGTNRTYWLWVPDGYEPNSSIPLIFAWHGSGGDGDEVRRQYFHLEPAVGDGAIIIYPDGLPVNGGSSGWDLDGEGIDVQLFDALLESVSQDYCIDQGRVFSTGYSFGGMFSYALACSRGSKLRGIAPTAGAFFGGGTCPTPVPAWIAHAPNDDIVDYSAATSARDAWLSTNDCGTTTAPTSPSPCVAYDCPMDAPVHWCSHNEGHEWPSFGSEGIWAFFSSL